VGANEQPVLAPGRQAEIDQIVAAAQRAASSFRELDQAAVDRIVLAMVKAGIRAAADLALLALEETGFGVVEDKMVKNYVATEFLWDYLKDKKSVGVIEEDADRNIVYVADPIGVVLAITPITNPTCARS
jgi:acetaldehyde dehydrogenase / alcohol dehydrogenase